MKKYVMFCSSNPNWLVLGKSLKNSKIAMPILWLGDDAHFDEACNEYGEENVQKLSDLRYHADSLKNLDYMGTFSDYFDSINYIETKDICLKMLDRIDEFGMMSRIDREVWFHNITIWTLKKLSTERPDFTLMSEPPHNHAQYLAFSILKYLNVPVYTFIGNPILPFVYFARVKNKQYLKIKFTNSNSTKEKFHDIFDHSISNIINRLNTKGEIPRHIQLLKNKERSLNNKVLRCLRETKDCFRFLKHPHTLFNRQYDSTNPLKFPVALRKYFVSKKKKALYREYQSYASKKISMDTSYVYFPLHYEPERTTLPDGGWYHDQFKAMIALRNLVPNDVKIIVKEHPSQFLNIQIGFKGRSPLFYSLIKNLHNVDIVGTNIESSDLIYNSQFVATITGTVGLEAALLKKKVLVLGEPWYKGIPNTFSIGDVTDYDDFMSYPIFDADHVRAFLLNEFNTCAVIGFQNLSSIGRYEEFLNTQFQKDQCHDLLKVISQEIN
jgi:hypothetical protein